jgi:hypothetical protein
MEKDMTEVKFYRKGHIITDADGNVVFTGSFKTKDGEFASINAAKRKSRELQAGLPPGSLRVKT